METGEIDFTKVKFGKEKLKIQVKSLSQNLEPLKLQKNVNSMKVISPKGKLERRGTIGLDNISLAGRGKSNSNDIKRTIMNWGDMNKNPQKDKLSTFKLKNLIAAKIMKSSMGNTLETPNLKKKKEVTFMPNHSRNVSKDRLKDDSGECSPNEVSLNFSEEASDHLQVPNSRGNSHYGNSSGNHESKIVSGTGEKVTKSTTKNLKQIIEENESKNEASEEDEKVQESQRQKKVLFKEPSNYLDTPRQNSVDDIFHGKEKQESPSQSNFFSESEDTPQGNRIWGYMRNSS